MADDDEHTAAEKGSQQVHPDKPARAGASPEEEPNENAPGRPQHEPHDPDEQISAKWRRGESNP